MKKTEKIIEFTKDVPQVNIKGKSYGQYKTGDIGKFTRLIANRFIRKGDAVEKPTPKINKLPNGTIEESYTKEDWDKMQKDWEKEMKKFNGGKVFYPAPAPDGLIDTAVIKIYREEKDPDSYLTKKLVDAGELTIKDVTVKQIKQVRDYLQVRCR